MDEACGFHGFKQAITLTFVAYPSPKFHQHSGDACFGFAPVARNDATVLLLGSMPGQASLQAQQYYAHPRNHFWKLMGNLLGIDEGAGYATKVHALHQARIALWDVLQFCVRVGSLDADIDRSSQKPNDFAAFFQNHAHITRVFFNGTAAEQIFRREVMRKQALPRLSYMRLPSSSPANASWTFEEKLAVWRAVVMPPPAT